MPISKDSTLSESHSIKGVADIFREVKKRHGLISKIFDREKTCNKNSSINISKGDELATFAPSKALFVRKMVIMLVS